MGRPQFQKLTVLSSAPGKSLVKIVATDTGPVVAGGRRDILVYAPAGKMGRVTSGYASISAIAGATGTHTLQIQPDIPVLQALLLTVNGNDNGIWRSGVFFPVGTAGVLPDPPGDVAQAILSKGLLFDSNVALRVTYKNNSNLTQNTDRSIILQVLYEDVS